VLSSIPIVLTSIGSIARPTQGATSKDAYSGNTRGIDSSIYAPVASDPTLHQYTPKLEPQPNNPYGKQYIAIIAQPLRLGAGNYTYLSTTSASGGNSPCPSNRDGPKDEGTRINNHDSNPYELLSAFEDRE
jgi:hypothetical protein